jgi:hypothetical protein
VGADVAASTGIRVGFGLGTKISVTNVVGVGVRVSVGTEVFVTFILFVTVGTPQALASHCDRDNIPILRNSLLSIIYGMFRYLSAY